MAHKFDVIVNGELKTYTEFEHIPLIIDHVVGFFPEIPPPPHTEADHDIIDQWPVKFNELMEREYASSSQNR